MIVRIVEGMTPSEYISAINDNLFGIFLNEYTPATAEMTSIELESNININLTKELAIVGARGFMLGAEINSAFESYGLTLDAPTDLLVEWVEDFASITFTNNSGTQHEIWENRNNEGYNLVHILDMGIAIFEYPTWQNATLNFTIRAKSGDTYSTFATKIDIDTPIILRTDQSTLHTIFIEHFRVRAGYVVNIDWGDDTNTDYTDDTGITKDYSTNGDYWITISGDTDEIDMIDWPGLGEVIYGDLTKLMMPSKMVMWHMFTHPLLIGDWTDIVWPPTLEVLNIATCGFSGSCEKWTFYEGLRDFHVSTNNFMGSFPIVPDNVAHYVIAANEFTGDVTNIKMPTSAIYPTVLFNISQNQLTGDASGFTMDDAQGTFYIHTNELTGDMSGMIIPDRSPIVNIQAQVNKITKMPRGNFRYVGEFNFSQNSCNTSEIDAFLAYLDTYFDGGIIPLVNCIYTLNGLGMGIPSAAGLASKTSIEGKYTAAGKTISILVNS